MSPQRPFPVTLLAFVVLSFTALNLLRFGMALTQWAVLAEFATGPYAFYIAATGLVWAMIGLALFIGLWRGLKLSRWGGLIVIASYVGYYWLDQLLVQKMPAQNGIYVLVMQAILLLFCGLTLVGAKGYFIKTVK